MLAPSTTSEANVADTKLSRRVPDRPETFVILILRFAVASNSRPPGDLVEPVNLGSESKLRLPTRPIPQHLLEFVCLMVECCLRVIIYAVKK